MDSPFHGERMIETKLETAIWKVGLIPTIPLAWGEKQTSKAIRLAALCAFIPWCVLTGIVLLPLVMLLMIAESVCSYVEGVPRT